MSAYQLQLGLYNVLSTDADIDALVVDVLDNPLQVEDPENAAAYPYITIGQAEMSPWDTDTETGFDAVLTIHTWSRKSHHLECKLVQDAIYSALHRATIPITGFHCVGVDMLMQDAQRDQDGVTIHGVQTFRVVFERV